MGAAAGDRAVAARLTAAGLPLVLASASPRRREILAQVGIPFEAAPTGADELEHGEPLAVAVENARRKALAGERPGRLTLGADTVVAADNALLGKPAGAAQARAHLRALSGREHRVCGGIALVAGGEVLAEAVEVTHVAFRALPDALVDWYVESGEWRDRAGGYAIQGRGAALVSGIRGDYLNVVGLPLARLLELAPHLLDGGGAGA